jgi:5'-methylthioadenosine phosphorylase
VCAELRKIIYNTGKKLGLAMHDKGAYLNMEGPAFSTRAESHLYKSWGMDIIGMTNMPEARLAREAEMCFATIAMVTDYDCWYEEDVNIEMVVGNLLKNVDTAKNLIKETVPQLSKERKCGCREALKYAIVTDKKLIPENTKEKLDIIIGKYV